MTSLEPTKNLAVVLIVVISVAVVTTFGCATPVEDAVPAIAEASVRPGINDSYYADSNPKRWTSILEGESREIFVHHERIVREVGLRPGQDVADVGAGTGLFTLPFAKVVGDAGRVYAVDILREFLWNIDRRAHAAEISNVTPVLCSEKSVELPPRSVDVVFVCDTYHHFEYPQNSLASIHRALRPDGELIVIDFERIPGKSREWVLGHVRAGEEVFTREIEEAGFERVERKMFLDENYFLRFKKRP